MEKEYRVIDLISGHADPVETTVVAFTPEAAASKLLGIEPVRSGARKDLVARVYWQPPGQPKNMVRLYRRVGDRSANSRGSK